MQTLSGTGIALITPFTANGTIDYQALERLIDYQIESGVDFLVTMGTTGEAATLSAKERQELLDASRKHIAGRVPLVLGLGGNNTTTLVQAAKELDTEGLAALLSVSPYYNKPTQAGIENHYRRLADASPLPIILYNVPGRTASNILAETTLRLAEHERIIGMKEASGNLLQCMELVRQRPEGFLLLSGDDHLTLPLIAAGFDGVISVLGNVYPKPFAELVALARQSVFAPARELQYKLYPLMDMLFEEGNPAGVKACAEALGFGNRSLREPLLPASEALAKRIAAFVEEFEG